MSPLFTRAQGFDYWRAIEPTVTAALEKGEDPDRIVAAVVRAFPIAVQDAADALADNLRARAPQLAEHRAFDRAFKRRLANTWSRAFMLYEIVLVCASEAGADFNHAYRRQAAREHDFVFEALTRLHAQSCLVARETFELLRGGYPHGAHARCRTLHELAVFAAVVGEHGQDIAERFLIHDAVENAAAAHTYQDSLAGRHGYEPFSQGEMEQIDRRRRSAIERYGRQFAGRYGWAATLFPESTPTFGHLEKLAGLGHLRPFYDWATHIGVHASSRGSRLNLVRRGRSQYLLAGPTNAGLADPGHGALISLVQVTTTLLIRVRPLDIDGMRLIILVALLKLTDNAGDEFLAAHNRLMAKEQRFQRRSKNARP